PKAARRRPVATLVATASISSTERTTQHRREVPRLAGTFDAGRGSRTLTPPRRRHLTFSPVRRETRRNRLPLNAASSLQLSSSTSALECTVMHQLAAGSYTRSAHTTHRR